MDSIIVAINDLRASKPLDEASRLKLQDALRGAAEALETPNDTMLRLFNASLEVAVVHTGCNLGIFKTLVASDTPLSVEKLGEASGADPLLLGRIMRYLASVRMVSETSQDHFAGNGITKTLADPNIEGSIAYTFNIGGPVYQAFPDYLREIKYQTLSPDRKLTWNKAMKTDLDFFPWAKQHPEKLRWFQQLMSVPRDGDWLDVAPFTSDMLATIKPDMPFFVDVGGSIGHQSARLRSKLPNLPGRIIVQDLAETTQSAPPIPGVEFMAHNFFNPQPIKGAKFYYLRTVLHDWDDDTSEAILKNLIPAMTPDSRILIDDMVLPNTGVHWWSSCLDLHMYTVLGAMERSVDQWLALIDRAGLRVVDIKTYMPVMRNSIIVVALK